MHLHQQFCQRFCLVFDSPKIIKVLESKQWGFQLPSIQWDNIFGSGKTSQSQKKTLTKLPVADTMITLRATGTETEQGPGPE